MGMRALVEHVEEACVGEIALVADAVAELGRSFWQRHIHHPAAVRASEAGNRLRARRQCRNLPLQAPAEKLAYIATFNPERKAPDALAVVYVDPSSASYAKIVGNLDLSNAGDELHHFGWNAYSSCPCPNAPHPHIERCYLILPSLRSSRKNPVLHRMAAQPLAASDPA
jgi:56kDa selenium binding protein (SBP56)